MNTIIFALHKFFIIIYLGYITFSKVNFCSFIRKVKFKLLLIVFISIIVNFSFLKIYPFVAVGDEIRDGALNAMEIANGEVTDILGYGSYNAHGLVIASFNSIFFKIFGNSVLSYRIPSALIAFLDVIVIFVVISTYINSTAAFWAALVLNCLPLHLFYGRTETVVIFSSLITSLLLYFALKLNNSSKNYFPLALLIGFSFNFHASAKTVAILLLPLLLFNGVFQKSISNTVRNIFISILAIIVGFGPTIFRTSFEIFFNHSRFDSGSLNPLLLLNKYFESLKVIAFSPTISHYFDHRPLISLPLFIIFVLGMIFLFKKKRNMFLLLAYLLFTIPFTNSAITDMVNADHRILPLLPIISIFIGYGIYYSRNLLGRYLKKIFTIIIFVYILSLSINFYYRQSANINDINNWREPQEYLSMHIIYLIQKDNFPDNITIYVSEYNAQNFNYLHYFEQYRFFLPHKNITFLADDTLNDYTAVFDTNKSKIKEINCNDIKNVYLCPLYFTNNFRIFY